MKRKRKKRNAKFQFFCSAKNTRVWTISLRESYPWQDLQQYSTTLIGTNGRFQPRVPSKPASKLRRKLQNEWKDFSKTFYSTFAWKLDNWNQVSHHLIHGNVTWTFGIHSRMLRRQLLDSIGSIKYLHLHANPIRFNSIPRPFHSLAIAKLSRDKNRNWIFKSTTIDDLLGTEYCPWKDEDQDCKIN